MRESVEVESTQQEMLSWLRALQEENRNLAGQLGYAQAQLDQAHQALDAMRRDAFDTSTGRSSPARMLESRATAAGELSGTRKTPWWRFWSR